MSSRVRALSFSCGAAPLLVTFDARAASCLPAPSDLIRFETPLADALAFVDLPALPESRACVAFTALAALTAEGAGAADAVLTASGEAVVRRAGRADPEDVTMFPQESQGQRMMICNCGYSGELRSKPVSMRRARRRRAGCACCAALNHRACGASTRERPCWGFWRPRESRSMRLMDGSA
ncbi:exported hypothetical protein [Paraburkholderia caribensis]|nr:exported hypothetical protein [Paraburkholderia caribensis]